MIHDAIGKGYLQARSPGCRGRQGHRANSLALAAAPEGNDVPGANHPPCRNLAVECGDELIVEHPQHHAEHPDAGAERMAGQSPRRIPLKPRAAPRHRNRTWVEVLMLILLGEPPVNGPSAPTSGLRIDHACKDAGHGHDREAGEGKDACALSGKEGRTGEGPGTRKAARWMVRKEGLEPSRLAALEPKSSASTHSATFARAGVERRKTPPAAGPPMYHRPATWASGASAN